MTTTTLDVLVVGAGFAGLYALHRLRAQGLAVAVCEAGPSVGGTWYWNRYPGARCDVESLQYSYSFSEELQREWVWSERFATQPEILRYLDHVADRFDLRRDIRFDTRVVAAHYDEAQAQWHVECDNGLRFIARHCIMATGCLTAPRLPDIPGIGDYAGAIHHTARWPSEGVDFSGLRVGVIGTGSTGIQSIPRIAEQAASLTVFQRTPNFSVPARNAPIDAAQRQWMQDNYPDVREQARRSGGGIFKAEPAQHKAMDISEAERLAAYDAAWQRGGAGFQTTFLDLLTNEQANHTAAEYVRARIAEIVQDPETARALSPTDHPIATKRICVDTDYYATYNLPHVRLVDLRRTPINRIEAQGIRTGTELHELDALVLATGFDAVTGALTAIDIRGRNGLQLREKWQAGPRTYLGLATAGFPNLHLVTGPGSPSVLSNMVVSIEQHVDWITDCLAWMQREGRATIEARADAEAAWVEHVNQVADTTLYPRANSWYVGANVPGKARVFLPYVGGVGAYRAKCEEVAAAGYTGFELAKERAEA